MHTEFTVLLAQMFPPAVQILAGFKLAQYLVQLPDFKPTGKGRTSRVVKPKNVGPLHPRMRKLMDHAFS